MSHDMHTERGHEVFKRQPPPVTTAFRLGQISRATFFSRNLM